MNAKLSFIENERAINLKPKLFIFKGICYKCESDNVVISLTSDSCDVKMSFDCVCLNCDTIENMITR